jgi:hypothetical protein
MTRAAPLPPHLAGRAFSVDEARAAGVNRSRTRAADLERPFRGVRSPQRAQSIQATCEAYAVRMPASQHFSLATAALLLDLPVPARLADDPSIHVTSTDGREPRVRGVRGHVAQPGVRVVEVDGLRMSHPVDTWCALAASVSVEDLVLIGDALVRRKNPLATMGDLGAAGTGFRGRRGVRKLAEAFALVRPGTDSPPEGTIRLMLGRAGLPEPTVNYVIANNAGEFLALGDLAYPAYRILIEYDGAYHFGADEQAHRDIDRLEGVMADDWRVIRFNRTHLSRETYVATTVRNALLARGWRP